MLSLKAGKCPTDELSITNCAIANDKQVAEDRTHLEVSTAPGTSFIITCLRHPSVEPGYLGFSLPQRKWASLSIGQELSCRPYTFSNSQYLSAIVLEADFLQKRSTTQEPYDTDKMAAAFSAQFARQAFTVGQLLVFAFENKKMLGLVVKSMQVADMMAIAKGEDSKPRDARIGLLLPNTTVQFEKADNSSLNLVGKSKGTQVRQSLINPDWDFNKMGIGGLDKEFNAIFRRAFASRVFPPEIIEQLGCKHVKGILLYGPPGTGKTLMARQIGQMLNAREPKIVNGPQILDKYVGESEANIRKLFAEAEEEEEKMGPNSGLHIIIFDELDAICKQRGSVASGAGVHDTVVNQLLSKIDGVKQLNNILVIGMTNRRDMIDEALLRPGRLEVQIEIGLPDEHGRGQILGIHTAKMRGYGKIAPDVDLAELAQLTKNFSGAELEGLVRAAQSTALNRLIKASNKVSVDPDAASKICVQRSDFLHALENDIKPAFGTSADMLEHFMSHGIISWGIAVQHIMEDAMLFIRQARSPTSKGVVTVLLEGPPNSGKTAIAAHLAKNSEFPFIKICSPEDMVGFTEAAKVQVIRKLFDDAYRSQLSCIVVDNIERLLEYTSVGPRFSNVVLQALLVLLKKEPPKGRKLLVLATSSRRDVLEQMDMLNAFTTTLRVPNISSSAEIVTVLRETSVFNEQQCRDVEKKLADRRAHIGIRKLLAVVEMCREVPERDRVIKFICRLEEDGHVELM
ncbi:vesicle-fusing ATPase 1-like [Amphibalanus amphitrite]|uniref:vesicle-fusing ATPase 1-like n=1 Tax=Amphibalanus amphitrite TaxID=1232801 RepID=UPI001C912EFA|nr:vesicle-fusing ATPase 1-like [Amphibalanus amphitrite]XP_043224975.1 vesicle-fusing ATPase 1-like [Amphibalanus amphitrite]XP_043224976.1 vesicle-fusing ATPase 1-like [Amphibalanus amphitrite]XP_043224977.1 vesicle-fusing ATPase 1-like [Amphibalanus amphitrite]